MLLIGLANTSESFARDIVVVDLLNNDDVV